MPDVDDRIAATTAFVPPIPEKLTDDDLLAALRSIPDQYQQVIVLCDLEEMTSKEIFQAPRYSGGNRNVETAPRPCAAQSPARARRAAARTKPPWNAVTSESSPTRS